MDGLLTAITDPYKTVEHVTGFAAYIEEVLPGMLEEIGGEWKQIWTEGSPEDQVRFCSYALTEVASWFIGVGEVRTAAASAKAATFADEPGRFVKWSKYFNRVDDVRHAGRVVSYSDEVSRFMTTFTDDISRQVSQNVDNAGRYLARIGKGAGNWVDNAGRGVSKMDFGDLRRWLRESLEDANERAQRMFDPELAGPEGWRMKMSEADEMIGGKKPAGPGEVNGGAGVEIKGGVESEEIAKVVDGPGKTGQYSGDLVKVDAPDAAADALAERIGGDSRVKFSTDPSGREFDVVSDEYIAQAKPDLRGYGKSWRNQTKATFEAALETGKTPYFQFEGEPSQSILNKIQEYSERYVIDTNPLGVTN